MKRIIPFLFLLLVANLSAQTTQKVLFIGNSYTAVNDLPTMTKTLAHSAGFNMETASSTPGGQTFRGHLSNTTTIDLINAGNWHYVVLQEQSQIPSFPIEQVEAECFPYAQQLCEKIRLASPNADIVFYMTWGRKNGDQSNCANYPPLCTYEGMDSLLYHRYMMMAETNHALVSPVGRVWHVLRDNHPEIELYSSDESHPSVAGTYAAACTFFCILFQQSPLRISHDYGLDATTAAAIRETVESVVFENLDFWQSFVNSDPTMATNATTKQFAIYPNPTATQCHFTWATSTTAAQRQVQIWDIWGRLLATEIVNSNEGKLDLSNYAAGVYVIRAIEAGKMVATQRIIKK